MAFKNMGTIDGGMAVMGNGVKSGAPAFAMDAQGIASGGAFLISELAKRDNDIRQPLMSFTYPRDIVVEVGGGWADYVEAMSVQYGVTGGAGASPVQAGGSNGLPIVQASYDKGAFKAHAFSVALRVMWQDMQRANFVGRSLDQVLSDGVRKAYDKHMDQNVYTGITEYGSTGLINDPNVTQTTAANGAGGTAAWSTKTPKEILKDINDAITAAWAAAEYDESAVPNHIILPYEQYSYLVNTMVTDLAGESILEYIKKNNIAKNQGRDVFIGGCRWCKGAGTGNTDRMVVYSNDRRFVKVDELVPLTRAMTQPSATNFCYDTAYAANLTEVQIFYPQTMLYVDGI